MKRKLIHAIKGFTIFAVIYMLAAVLVELVLIAGLAAMGYDAVHGQLPDSFWTGLFPLYGFAAFAVLSILFQRLIRRKTLEDMRLRFCVGSVLEMSGGMAVGAVLVGISIAALCLAGAYEFNGSSKVSAGIMLAAFGGYLVQGFSEELLCRGLLQAYFEERLGTAAAVLLSALAFMLPHAATFMELEPMEMTLSFVNLLLVSVLFSFSMMRSKSLWVPAGIHIGWNYALSYICGIRVSGGEGTESLLNFSANSADWLHGGAYGIEAGCVVTILLLVCDVVLYKTGEEKRHG